MRIIMTVFRFFIKFNALFFIGLALIQPIFAATVKTKTDAVETQTQSSNGGKTDNFNYTHTFYREKKITATNGKTEIKRESVAQTLPGEELLAVTKYTYIKNKTTHEAIFTLRLPKEATYVEGSVTDAKYAWFSSDNGKTWSRYADLRVTESDGTKRIATGKDVTDLQWRMASVFKKGDTGTLEYKVIIR